MAGYYLKNIENIPHLGIKKPKDVLKGVIFANGHGSPR